MEIPRFCPPHCLMVRRQFSPGICESPWRKWSWRRISPVVDVLAPSTRPFAPPRGNRMWWWRRFRGTCRETQLWPRPKPVTNSTIALSSYFLAFARPPNRDLCFWFGSICLVVIWGTSWSKTRPLPTTPDFSAGFIRQCNITTLYKIYICQFRGSTAAII